LAPFAAAHNRAEDTRETAGAPLASVRVTTREVEDSISSSAIAPANSHTPAERAAGGASGPCAGLAATLTSAAIQVMAG
jgi:hypothetical protein